METHSPRRGLTARASAAVAVAAIAVAAVSGGAAGAKSPPTRLFDARACSVDLYGSGDWDYDNRVCRTKTADQQIANGGYDCSVQYSVAKPTRLTARVLYENHVQRATTRTVDGSGTEAIGVAFAALEAQYSGGMPGGRYACEFSLGPRRARVAFTGRGSRDAVRVPAACSTARTSEHACDFYSPDPSRIPPTHSVTCSAVFVGRQGRAVEIDILRGSTVLYAGKDSLRYPITSEWARTSAPPRQFLGAGDYACRFLVDGSVIAERPFTIAS